MSDGSLLMLSKLLGEQHEQQHATQASSTALSGPGDIGPPRAAPAPASARAEQPSRSKARNTKDIWDDDEVPDTPQTGAEDDPRPQPEYDIMYKQAVSPEDMYLGLSGRNPTTASCEDLLIKVKLPGTKYADVELDVTSERVDVRTPKFRLCLPLPQPVDADNGSAKWDAARTTLAITLPMKREYDFLYK